MAAGCKPAAPWSYGGSNPPLCTRISKVSRFSIAMLVYLLLAALAVTTLTASVPVAGRQVPVSAVTLVVLAMFALRTWLHRKREALERNENKGQ